MIDSNFRSIVNDIERLEEQQRVLLANKRNIYTKAKNSGIDIKALRKIITERRMPDREQVETAMRDMRIALEMAVNDVADGASLRLAAAKYDIPKSTLHDAVRREVNVQPGQQVDDDLDIPKHLDQRRDRSGTCHTKPPAYREAVS